MNMENAAARPIMRTATPTPMPAATAGEVLLIFVLGIAVEDGDDIEEDVALADSNNFVVTTLSDPPIVVE
ncbi:hypothetical protein DID88_009424 [Monilinia fructigena]|uniref:Uncharacterized protein n=1 Tax=Monilinia fructigena TaxID=38457 RepID=A0A395IMH5_9HELO|nr:hypothetical protein DID88_009424 [Monilinia fructigena]